MNQIARTLNNQADANLAKLPCCCYALFPESEEGKRIVLIKAGERGAYVTDLDDPSQPVERLQQLVQRLNRRLGVTQAQLEAMVAGSMFGWHVKGADPDTYLQPRFNIEQREAGQLS